jgi:hypothetical protein
VPYDFSQPFQMHLYRRSTSSARLRGLRILCPPTVVIAPDPVPWPPTLSSGPSSPLAAMWPRWLYPFSRTRGESENWEDREDGDLDEELMDPALDVERPRLPCIECASIWWGRGVVGSLNGVATICWYCRRSKVLAGSAAGPAAVPPPAAAAELVQEADEEEGLRGRNEG